jgi:L-2,4-diaminobutyrate decarboxylase
MNNLLELIRSYFLLSWDTSTQDKLQFFLDKYLRKIYNMSSDIPGLGNETDIAEKYKVSDSELWVEDGQLLDVVIEEILNALPGSIDFAHPKAIFAASPPVTIPSLIGSLIVQHLNPNLVWGSWGVDFSQMEIDTIQITARIIGYDPKTSGGIFTYGGSGTMLYGAKIGLEKSCPETKKRGIHKPVKIFAKKRSHYSKFIVANWLGIGVENWNRHPTI